MEYTFSVGNWMFANSSCAWYQYLKSYLEQMVVSTTYSTWDTTAIEVHAQEAGFVQHCRKLIREEETTKSKGEKRIEWKGGSCFLKAWGFKSMERSALLVEDQRLLMQWRMLEGRLFMPCLFTFSPRKKDYHLLSSTVERMPPSHSSAGMWKQWGKLNSQAVIYCGLQCFLCASQRW